MSVAYVRPTGFRLYVGVAAGTTRMAVRFPQQWWVGRSDAPVEAQLVIEVAGKR
jgi:hypothetical protein